MTFATKITILRMFLVPVFAVLAVAYGLSVGNGAPVEEYRLAALAVFIAAAASDGIDGWIARHFNQISELGAFLDPIADKALVFSAVIILTLLEWGPDGWGLPIWFCGIVVLRDVVILAGIRILYSAGKKVAIKPHWTGKACTFALFVVLAWVMLQVVDLPPAYPCLIASVFIILSMLEYIRQGIAILRVTETP
ncbi:CDP-alcohol phosphatidyltransferase family protein [Akkermansiaceae bacterium]|nr:CDP-alcohol phosphatidyltransferase family protein [Akkermansiaceae bacterium]